MDYRRRIRLVVHGVEDHLNGASYFEGSQDILYHVFSFVLGVVGDWLAYCFYVDCLSLAGSYTSFQFLVFFAGNFCFYVCSDFLYFSPISGLDLSACSERMP